MFVSKFLIYNGFESKHQGNNIDWIGSWACVCVTHYLDVSGSE